LIVSSISVTAPLRASARPFSVTPESIEIDVKARMLPANVEDVPSVAELPICQNTLAACAPPIRFTWLLTAVVNAEPTWSTNTAFGSPWPSRVSVPVTPSEGVAPVLYTPGGSVSPPMSAGSICGGWRKAASL